GVQGVGGQPLVPAGGVGGVGGEAAGGLERPVVGEGGAVDRVAHRHVGAGKGNPVVDRDVGGVDAGEVAVDVGAGRPARVADVEDDEAVVGGGRVEVPEDHQVGVLVEGGEADVIVVVGAGTGVGAQRGASGGRGRGEVGPGVGGADVPPDAVVAAR